MPKVTTPTTLSAFPTSTDGVWSFPFGLVFDKAIHSTADLRFEIMIDTFPTFASPNLINVFSDGANLVEFQDGPLGKAFDVRLPKRSSAGDTVWYWKIRINGYGYGGGYLSDWSQTNSVTVPKNQSRSISQALWDDVADGFSYSKEANSSNFYKVLNMIGRELDQALLENTYTQRDLSLEMSRDAGLRDNFGNLVGLQAVATEPAVSYRWKVRELFRAFIKYPGVVTGIKNAVKAFVGEDPTIFDANNIRGWILPINHIADPEHPEIQPTIILYSLGTKGFHWTLRIWNSWGLTYDSSVLENYVNLIKPAHTRTTFIYVTEKHVQIRMNSASDWNACTLTNLTTNASGGLTLSGSNTSGTAVTPVIHISNMNAWDTLELDRVLSGNTITIELRTAPAASGPFTAYETLVLGQAPISTTLQDYLQLRVSISTTDTNYKPILNSLQLNALRT